MTLRVGVCGLGFMGRTHLAAYAAARAAGRDCEVVAVADRSAERRAGKLGAGGNIATGEAAFDAERVRGYETAEQLCREADVDVVSLCTPTATHVELALAALESGKHVLVEKPVALGGDDVERLARAARAGERLCMPAMCVRFWPGWDWLKQRVDDGAYGAVRSAVFRRLGARPDWSDAYADPARTGGALFDLHLHDADFARWTFGEPDGVQASGTPDHLTALWTYRDGPPHVALEAGWDVAPSFPFTMAFTVAFERATADFLLGRDAPLRLHEGDSTTAVDLPDTDGYRAEVAAFLDAVATGAPHPPVTLGEAVAVTRLLERERAALAGA